MIGASAYTLVGGGAVMVEGIRYDLDRVLESSLIVLDRLVARFSVGAVRCGRLGFSQKYLWHEKGRDAYGIYWRAGAAKFDAIDASFLLHAGQFTFKAMMLGEQWCVYHKGEKALRTPTGDPVSLVDPMPFINLYGKEEGDGRFAMPTPGMISAVEECLAGVVSARRLRFEKTRVIDGPVPAQVGFVVFPAASYGISKDWLRVRVVTPDGGEVGLKDRPE
jgi:hypothetical protein